MISLILFALMNAANATPTAPFEFFKNLEGRWAIRSGEKNLSIEMTYEPGSKGSIVTEQFGKELSVISQDADQTVITHFCNAGNSPRLKYKNGAPASTYVFETFEVKNLAAADAPHVKKMIYEFVDAAKIRLELVWSTGTSEKYVLTKIK